MNVSKFSSATVGLNDLNGHFLLMQQRCHSQHALFPNYLVSQEIAVGFFFFHASLFEHQMDSADQLDAILDFILVDTSSHMLFSLYLCSRISITHCVTAAKSHYATLAPLTERKGREPTVCKATGLAWLPTNIRCGRKQQTACRVDKGVIFEVSLLNCSFLTTDIRTESSPDRGGGGVSASTVESAGATLRRFPKKK